MMISPWPVEECRTLTSMTNFSVDLVYIVLSVVPYYRSDCSGKSTLDNGVPYYRSVYSGRSTLDKDVTSSNVYTMKKQKI